MGSSLRLVGSRADLPARWDGRAVLWGEWRIIEQLFVCDRTKRKPPEPDRCACGALTSTSHYAVGLVADDADTTVAELATDDRFARYGRPRRGTRSLTAYRCPSCGADEVYDAATGEWWTLDESDYGPDGSTAPETAGG